MSETFPELLSGLTSVGTYALSSLRPFDGPPLPPAIYLLVPVDETGLGVLLATVELCPADPLHILYIGATRSTSPRLQCLVTSVKPDTSGLQHSAGFKLRHCLGVDLSVLADILAVAVYPADRPSEVESKLLGAYRRTYGALPLLNRRLRPLHKSFTNVLRVAEGCASQGVPDSDSPRVDEKSASSNDSLMSTYHGREAGEGSL